MKALHAIAITALEVRLDGEMETRLFALEDGAVVGVLSVKNMGRPAATLFQLFVAEGARGRGVGSKLVEEAAEMAAGAGSAALSAIMSHEGLMGFYARLGFEPVHHEGGKTLVSKALVARIAAAD